MRNGSRQSHELMPLPSLSPRLQRYGWRGHYHIREYSLKGSTSNYVCLFTRHLLGMHHSTLRTLSGQWLICHREPRCGQHLVAICMCHEHVGGSETERLLLRPHACGIVYLFTSNSTGRQQLSNAILKLFYLTGASLNICK